MSLATLLIVAVAVTGTEHGFTLHVWAISSCPEPKHRTNNPRA
jgi:hypothetical protein